MTEVLKLLEKAYGKYYRDGRHTIELGNENKLQLNRSYSCTAMVAEPSFLLVVIDCGTYLVHQMNPASSRKLIGVDFMYRKKPASRAGRTVAKCHVLSISPLSILVVDLIMFLGTFLPNGHTWDHRLRVAQVELKYIRPEGSVRLEFVARHRISESLEILKQASRPTMGLYFFHDVKNSSSELPPAIEWFGALDSPSQTDLFSDDNIEFRLANWMKASPLPQPRLSKYKDWRDEVDKTCFGADWVSHTGCTISAHQFECLIKELYPDLSPDLARKRIRH